MKKTILLSLCGILIGILFSSYPVQAEEYPITLSVSVKNDGSVQIKAEGDKSVTHLAAVCIYREGDIVDLSLPRNEQIASIAGYDLLKTMKGEGVLYPRSGEGYTRRFYQEMESWWKFRLDALTDGPNSPLKPGKYFAVAIYQGEVDPDRFLSEPVAFEMGEWERSLKVEQEENGSFAFETKGFFGGCCSVRVYLQGKECDPTTNKGSVLSWPIDFTLESRKTYPEGCGRDVGYHDLSALKGEIPTRPLKNGNYYAIVVDEEKDQILTDPVTFEVSSEAEPSPAPSSATAFIPTPISEPSAELADRENGANGDTILYLCIGAAVLVVAIVVIVFAVKRKSK